MKTKEKKTSEILRKAKKLIEKPEKWCTGQYFSQGSMCSVGAVIKASGQSRKEFDVCRLDVQQAEETLNKATMQVVNNTCSESFGCVVDYNDAPRRSHKQIMKLFDIAIKIAEKQELKGK